MLLFILACSVPEGTSESDSVEELDSEPACGHASDGANIDPENACHDGDQLLVESGYDGPGTHFEWTVEGCFVAAGGSIPDVDAPSVEVQCPPCRGAGTVLYEITIDITDDDGNPVSWGFGSVAQVCPDE